MPEGFDVNKYWIERGKQYVNEERLNSAYYRLQERFLLDTLKRHIISPERILEIGCGFGRITRLLALQFPAASITALDLSRDQLRNAERYCAGLVNIRFLEYDIYSGEPLPNGAYDLGIAIEVFLHHPADVVGRLIERLGAVADRIVNIDWSENWEGDIAEHVWVHDYEELYEAAGLQCRVWPVPEKIDGLQQRLFVASRKAP